MKCLLVAVVTSLGWLGVTSLASAQDDGWKIPPTASSEKSPLSGDAEAVSKGKSVYQKSCQRCHGTDGRGAGPQSDPKAPAADLTKMKMDANPDGVLFYKLWNGHEPSGVSKGRMPAFKSQLVKDDVWRLVEYLKALASSAT